MPAICLIRVVTSGDLPDSPLIRAIPQRSLSTQPPAPPAHRDGCCQAQPHTKPPTKRKKPARSVCADRRPFRLCKGSSVSSTNHARVLSSQQQPTARARVLERTPPSILAPLRRACTRAVACGGGVVPFVTSPPLLRAPPAANAESPSCHVVGCVSVSRRGEEGRVEV